MPLEGSRRDLLNWILACTNENTEHEFSLGPSFASSNIAGGENEISCDVDSQTPLLHAGHLQVNSRTHLVLTDEAIRFCYNSGWPKLNQAF